MNNFQIFIKNTMLKFMPKTCFEQAAEMTDYLKRSVLEIVCQKCCFNADSEDVQLAFNAIIKDFQ